MKIHHAIFRRAGIVLLSISISLALDGRGYSQTQIVHDLSGDRSSEISNQPTQTPVITAQPRTILGQVGGIYRFTVTAVGVNLSYQWYKDSAAIPGQTSDTLTIANAQSGDFSNHAASTGLYSVSVSNSAGTVTSNPAALYLDSQNLGMPDWWQIQYFGAVGVVPYADADGDGVTNLQEYLDGTNPVDPTSADFTLTTAAPVTAQPLAARYPAGTQVNLTVAGAYLQNWTGDASGSANPLSVSMTRNKSIQAVTTDYPNTHLASSLSSNGNANVRSLLVESDGHIVAAGVFDTFLGRPQWNLGRLNANGTLDTAFFPGSQSHFQSAVYDMVQQPDGKLIVVGNFSHSTLILGANPPNYIARLNADGSLDESFMATGKYPNSAVYAVGLQADGHILIAGSFNNIGSASAPGLARLNSDGTMDTTFAVGSGVSGTVSSGCLQVDTSGNIYVGGNFSSYNGVTVSSLFRVNSSGGLDTSFATGTGFNSSVTALTVRSGGGIYVGGSFTQYQGNAVHELVALTNSGTVDSTFNAGSASTSGTVYRIALQSDNKLVLALSSTFWQGQSRSYALRLNSNGTVDSSFSPQINGPLNSVAVQSTGQIVVGGTFSTVNGIGRTNLARLNADGSLDATAVWNASTASSNNLGAVAVQSDGKLLLSGNFTLVGNTSATGFVRLNTDGSYDSTFVPGSGPNSKPQTIVALASGQILLGGSINSYNGAAVPNLARINTNGTLDTAFNTTLGSGPNGAVYALAVQPDGKMVIVGSFSKVNNAPRNNIARLNADGSLDLDFAPATDNTIYAVAIDTQGNVLIGGGFSLVDGQNISNLARLNPDGSVDSTFNPSAPNGPVNQIFVSQAGQIVVAGSFTQMGNLNQHGLARLNSNGTLDPLPGQNSLSTINSMGLQSDGSIVLALASGIQIGTSSNNYLCRLTPAGVLDSNFHPQPNASLSGVLIGGNNDIYALGNFTTDISEYAAGIADYSASPNLSLRMTGTVPANAVTTGTPITLNGQASSAVGTVASADFQVSSDGINYQLASVAANQGSGQWTGVWAPPNSGTYYLRLAATDTTGTSGVSGSLPYAVSAGSPQIAAPAVSVPAGSYSTTQTIAINSSTPGVQIFYTTDGSDPSSSPTRIFLGNGGTILISQTTTLNIEAFYGSGSSTKTTATYTITPQPVPALPGWSYPLVGALVLGLASRRLLASKHA